MIPTRPLFSQTTQTDPAPIANPSGASHTSIVAITASAPGSMRDTVSLSEFDTQIEPNPAVVSSGTSPTGIVAITAFVDGSILDTAG